MALQHFSGHFGRGQLPIHTVPGQASQAVYQYLEHILSPVTDNCPSWISERERMAIEIVFMTNLHEKMPDVRIKLRPSACKADYLCHP